MKVMTIVGTRPELIRLSKTIELFDQYVNHILVHTGQNYDYELNEIFFKELGIRKPNYFLEAQKGSLGAMIGDIIAKIETVLTNEMPDAILILGDTNSSLCAIIAKRMKIPIYHMEAGNRSFDDNVPEEINRKIVDHISDFNLVYTEHSRRHLISEGISHRRIILTGSPLYEVLNKYLPDIEKSEILKKMELKRSEYFLISAHREENVDNGDNLEIILNALNSIAEIYGKDIIFSVHPRTKNRIEKMLGIKFNKKIRFLKPFGYYDYIKLQQNAYCTLSDSGTISEESSILKFPAVTIRNSMERPEALDSGNIILTGINEESIINSVNIAVTTHNSLLISPREYEVPNTSLIVLKLILGTAKLSNKWSGIIK